MQPDPTLPTIFVAEDDPADLELLQQGLLDVGSKHPVRVFGNGAEIIQFLRDSCAASEAESAVRPRLLFLDLHIPQVDGCGVLAWIKKQKALADLRVVVLSGSGDSKDVQRAEALGADRLLLKPASDTALLAELKLLAESPRARRTVTTP